MRVREWFADNIAFLFTLIFGAVALYTTFQLLVYRMDRVEARVAEFENMVITRVEYESLEERLNRIEAKLDRLIER